MTPETIIVAIAAAVGVLGQWLIGANNYGKLSERVETHSKAISALWDKHEDHAKEIGHLKTDVGILKVTKRGPS